MPKRSYKKVTKTEFSKYRKLAQAGYSGAEIAQICGVKRHRVRNAFYNRGTTFTKVRASAIRKAARVDSVSHVSPVNAKPNNIWPHIKLGFMIGTVVAACAGVAAFITGA